MRRGFRAMNAVAGGAGQVPALVPAPLPARVFAAVVTAQTGLVDLGRLDLAELADVSLVVVVHMRLAGSVTALAAVGGRWTSRVHRHRVRSALQRLTLGVTRLAGVTSDVSCLRIWRRLLRGGSLCSL